MYVVNMERDKKIVVVGCGGTGGFVAEGLCRLFARNDPKIILVDHDKVEPPNLLRQNFYEEDLGKFKSEVLATRLARKYRLKIAYSVYPYERKLLNEKWGRGLTSLSSGIIIGCVDRASARRSISESLEHMDWWLDAGNSYQSGQVLFGNTRTAGELDRSFCETDQAIDKLPMPSLQLPSLLSEPTTKKQQLDCAEAIDDGQSPVINQAMATLVLEFMHRLLSNRLTWMGAYLDLETGRLSPVPADPLTVARMFGIQQSKLTYKIENCSRGMYLPRNLR